MASEHELIKQLVEEADRLADALNTPGIDMAEAVALIDGWYKGRLRVKALSITAGVTV